jgi:hypothetical protein
MGDISMRGRGCVTKKFNCGGSVKLAGGGGVDACTPPKSQGMFENDSTYKSRVRANTQACFDQQDAERTTKASADVASGAKVLPTKADATELGIRGYAKGNGLSRRMKEAGLE